MFLVAQNIIKQFNGRPPPPIKETDPLSRNWNDCFQPLAIVSGGKAKPHHALAAWRRIDRSGGCWVECRNALLVVQVQDSVREYVFYVFFLHISKNMTFYVFFEMTYQKVVKSL